MTTQWIEARCSAWNTVSLSSIFTLFWKLRTKDTSCLISSIRNWMEQNGGHFTDKIFSYIHFEKQVSYFYNIFNLFPGSHWHTVLEQIAEGEQSLPEHHGTNEEPTFFCITTVESTAWFLPEWTRCMGSAVSTFLFWLVGYGCRVPPWIIMESCLRCIDG